jgi:hypothetical protein
MISSVGEVVVDVAGVGEEQLAAQAGQRRHRVAEVELKGLHDVGVPTHALARARQHVGGVVGHQVADAGEVVAALLLACGREGVQPHLRALAVAHAELEHVDLVGELGPLLEAVEGGHEGVDPVGPEGGVRTVGDPSGQSRRVVLLEGLVPRPQVAPVAAVERPHDALARAHPVLEMRALVDVGHEPQRLGEPVDDLRAQRRAVDRARPADVDGDLGQRLVAARAVPVADERAHHHRRAEVLAVLHPVEHHRQARVVEVHRGGRLAERGQDRRQVVGSSPSDGLQLDDHRVVSLAPTDGEQRQWSSVGGDDAMPEGQDLPSPPGRIGLRIRP